MNRWIEITFDCLPLRTIGRFDIPLDASPKYRARCERIKQAIEKHGQHNAYFLYNAKCVFHLVNHDELGMIAFTFEGVVLTNSSDAATDRCDLAVDLQCETCDWLTEPIVEWFTKTVSHSVAVEFDRYIEAGDLAEAKQRIETIQAASDKADGFVGMYL
jgi:hypothetical protein